MICDCDFVASGGMIQCGIRNSDKWMYDIHAKSVENDRSFNKQLLLDIFHTLTLQDKILTLDEAERLQAKYEMVIK